MRLWTVHPKHLDPVGLIALWREGLLARKVLLGQTKGYKKHPQLDRFYAMEEDAVFTLDIYLSEVWRESDKRGYQFNRKLIGYTELDGAGQIPVTSGQLLYEAQHLDAKLLDRKPELRYDVNHTQPHPLFRVEASCPELEPWERPGDDIQTPKRGSKEYTRQPAIRGFKSAT